MGDYARELGRRMQRRREELGYTQQDIATMLRRERSTVAGWEVGKRMPDLETFDRLEAILGPLRPSAVDAPRLRPTGGLQQLKGMLRAQGATAGDIKAIFHILKMREEARRRERGDTDSGGSED